jgi:S-adenosylmethionine decarboxylase proenzyme
MWGSQPLLAALLLARPLSGAPLAGPKRMGTHILLEVTDAPFAVLNSSSQVMGALRAAVAAGGLTVVGEVVHQFPEQGFSAVIMISESHLSVHTWPEAGYAAVDLFTCGAAAPLPCHRGEAMRFGGPDAGWRCADGQLAEGRGALWDAAQALLGGLRAGGAALTWLDRGLPGRPSDPPSSFGWLGGLEGDSVGGQRPEL